MKRVLITGAGGFMGSHVFLHLLHNTDWELILLDSFRHRGKTDRINEQLLDFPEYRKRIQVVTHDLTVPFSTQMIDKLGKLDYILSIASESHVDRSITNPREFIENNVALILTLLEYIRVSPVEKFIHISTDEVYGPAYGDHKHKEGESHRPSNPYSASKAAQEDICFSYWRTYKLPIIITNTMNIIGEMQDVEKFIPMTINKVLKGEIVDIHASGDGVIGSRYYLHARNQADALLFILKNIDPDMYGDTHEYQDIEYSMQIKTEVVSKPTQFNIVGEREVSNSELAHMVANFAGKDLTYKLVDFHSSRPGHDLRYALDGSRLRAAGWSQPLPFGKSLEKTVKWTMENRQWLQ